MSENENIESEGEESVAPKKKYNFIEDIPGVGPATSQKTA
jgi:hypothetical protein